MRGNNLTNSKPKDLNNTFQKNEDNVCCSFTSIAIS